EDRAIDANLVHRRDHLVAGDVVGPVRHRVPRALRRVRLVGVDLGIDDRHRRRSSVLSEFDITAGPSPETEARRSHSLYFRTARLTASPSASKSRRRGDVLRHASPIVRPGSGAAKRFSDTRLSRTSTSAAISGTKVTPKPAATICITVASDVEPRLAAESRRSVAQKASA